MKPVNLSVGMLILSVFLLSCDKEEVDYGLGEYRVELATTLFSQETPYFLLDNGKSLYNADKLSHTNLKEGQRVKLNYAILPESHSGYDYTIRINAINALAQGVMVGSDRTTIDQQANDPIQFGSAWIGSHYLNLQFSFQYKSQSHKIYLLVDSFRLTDKEIPIFFKHGTNQDQPGYKQAITASYDLKNLLGEPGTGKVLIVHFNTTNYGDTVFRFNY